MINELDETGKFVVDVASGVTVVSTLMGWIPAVTALLSLVWVAMRIYQTGSEILATRAKKRLQDENKRTGTITHKEC